MNTKMTIQNENPPKKKRLVSMGWRKCIILSSECGLKYTWWGEGSATHGPSAGISPAGAEDWAGVWGHEKPDNAPPSGAAAHGSSAPTHTGGSAGQPHTHSLNSTGNNQKMMRAWTENCLASPVATKSTSAVQLHLPPSLYIACRHTVAGLWPSFSPNLRPNWIALSGQKKYCTYKRLMPRIR